MCSMIMNSKIIADAFAWVMFLFIFTPHLKDIKIPFARCLKLHRHRNLNGIPRAHSHIILSKVATVLPSKSESRTQHSIASQLYRVPSK